MSRKTRKDMVEARRGIRVASEIMERAINVLNRMPAGEQREHLIKMLRSYVINNNCSLIVHPENTISPEHKLLIRDDCNGYIANISGEFLSPEYVEAKKSLDSPLRYNVFEYGQALEESVYGREMEEYPSYRAIQYPLLLNLINQHISPQQIKSMHITDFRDFVKEFCYDDFVKYHDENGFVKVFIRENEADFYNLLQSNGIHPAYIDRLIENMHNKGSADAFKFEYKGQIIEGPGFDVDHKNPVYCPNNISSYPEVNNPRSLVVIEKGVHRMKHKLERAVVNEEGCKMYEKILLPQYCAAMLDFEHYLVHDFDNPHQKINVSDCHSNNLIYINKIEEFLNITNLSEENSKARAVRNYINKCRGSKNKNGR